MASLAAAAVMVVTAERRCAHRYDRLAAGQHIVSLPAVAVTAAGAFVLGLVRLSIVLILSAGARRVPIGLVDGDAGHEVRLLLLSAEERRVGEGWVSKGRLRGLP